MSKSYKLMSQCGAHVMARGLSLQQAVAVAAEFVHHGVFLTLEVE